MYLYNVYLFIYMSLICLKRYQCYYFASEVANFPFDMMSKFENKILHAIWPGPRGAKSPQVQLVLRVWVDELNQLFNGLGEGRAFDPRGMTRQSSREQEGEKPDGYVLFIRAIVNSSSAFHGHC